MATIFMFLLILKVASAGKLDVVRAGNNFTSLLGRKVRIGLGLKRLFANCM
jgi:hypothetical protein